MGSKRIYIIGLDGFNMKLFRALEEEGVVPHLSRLMNNGLFGPLRSTIPSYTGPAWVSMFTGVNPGRHGIYGFTRRSSSGYDSIMLNSSIIGAPKIWDMLNREGLSVGIFNVPFTFPPERVDGFMISGMLTPSLKSEFTYPPELKSRLGEDYLIDISLNLEKEWDNTRVVDRLEEELKGKRVILNKLLSEYDPDFLMTVFVLPDRIQHLWWKYICSSGQEFNGSFRDRVRTKVFSLFKELDEAIGELGARLDKDDILLIVSDHGFTSFDYTFYLNSWLIRENYLKLKSGGESISRISKYLNISGLKKLLPRSVLNYAGSGSIRKMIDWNRTRAYASSNMEEGIYINLSGREPQGQVEPGTEYEKLLTEIKDRLKEFSISPDSAPIFRDILQREELYRGDFVDHAPDLLLHFEDGWNMSSNIPGKHLWRSWSDLPYGVHHLQGFWGVSGGATESRSERVEADIKDIFPTVLSLLEIPVPPGLEGKTIEAVASPVFASGQVVLPDRPNSSSSLFSPSEAEEIKDRLEGLGYI